MKTNFKLIYLLPNLFTAASIFMGILSIISSVKGEFYSASILIVASMIFDGLDGRVARLTNTTSQFGVEFDSLADVVAFGVAPAMLVYYYVGVDYGKFGTLVAAIFVIFGAIRLARFNVSTANVEPSVFIGIPIPAAAVFISMWVTLYSEYNLKDEYSIYLMFASLLASVLMVSNIRYPSFKKMPIDKQHTMKILVLLIALLSLVYIFTIQALTIIITIYIFSGLIRSIFNIATKRYKQPTDKNPTDIEPKE
jgi:CDP-diacylglycerol--serine O-phosphatidyltransferase